MFKTRDLNLVIIINTILQDRHFYFNENMSHNSKLRRRDQIVWSYYPIFFIFLDDFQNKLRIFFFFKSMRFVYIAIVVEIIAHW